MPPRAAPLLHPAPRCRPAARLAVALTLAAVALGCAPIGKLRTRAAFDLDCKEAELEVVDLDDVTKGVRGCGRKATYIWVCAQGSTCAWVMNTDAGRSEP